MIVMHHLAIKSDKQSVEQAPRHVNLAIKLEATLTKLVNVGFKGKYNIQFG